MPTKIYPYIAREGHGIIAIVAGCAAALQFSLGSVAALPAWLGLVLTLYLFRDPSQTPPSQPLGVVSPIHGRVLAVAETRDPWLKRAAVRVTIRTGLFDIRSIYAPVEGKIMEQWNTLADPLPADDNPPHSNAFFIRTDEDDEVVMVITRSDLGGRLTFNYNPGERVGHGRRLGYANLGCTVRLYLPLGTRPEVVVDDKVAAASSVVAMFVHLTAISRAPENREAPGAPPPPADDDSGGALAG